MRYQGRITVWKDEQGFGFIKPSQGGDDVFLHITGIVHRSRRPVGNELVTYALTYDERGRPMAEEVLRDGERSLARGQKSALPAALIAAGFLIIVCALTADGRLPRMVPSVYLLTSAVAFLVYAKDKSAAATNRWRTPECKLLYLALIGGWPGALVARHIFRHKTSKQSFIAGFWVMVILNCAVLICLALPAVRRDLIALLKTWMESL